MKNIKIYILFLFTMGSFLSSCGMFGSDETTLSPDSSTAKSDSSVAITDSSIVPIDTLSKPSEIDLTVRIKDVNEGDIANLPEKEIPAEELTVEILPDTNRQSENMEVEIVKDQENELIINEQNKDSIDTAEELRLAEEQKIREAELEAKKIEDEINFSKKETGKVDLTKISPSLPGKTSIDVIKKYESTLSLVKSGNQTEAIIQFTNLLNGEVKKDFADNCYYWIGESKFGLKDYNGALENFKKVFDFNISEKKDDAQYMVARCYEKLGNFKQAKAEFKKLVEMYPLSELVQKAEKKLK